MILKYINFLFYTVISFKNIPNPRFKYLSLVELKILSQQHYSSCKVDDIANHKFSVAPMMEYTNCHQRYLFRLISKKSVLYTEMVVANALVRSENKERLLEANFAEEEPLVLQLGGSDPNDMKLAVKIASNYGYKQFNINCGCPSEKVAGAGCFGAALMLQPELVSSLALAVYETSGKSATIKCRLGVDDQDSYEQLASFITMVSTRGNVKHFIVHARKAILNQNFSPHENRNIPKLRYDYVYKLVNDFPNLSFTINGGITNYTQIEDHFSNGVKGVMVGRSVINEPFYWNDIDHTIYNTKDANSLNRREILFKYCDYADYIAVSYTHLTLPTSDLV